MNNTLYIIIPCFNEEDALPITAEALLRKLRGLITDGMVSSASKILLIDDGSRDATWNIIAELAKKYREFCGVRLSGNRGTQSALMAGMAAACPHADMVVSTDADLQDDIGAIDRMVAEYKAGADIVYGVRAKRETDTFFKRFTAEMYYKILTWLECGTVFNHSDYRLLSRRAITALLEYGERDMFIRGILPMLGFKSATVTYDRRERNAGTTKYTFKSLMRLAAMGITSLSIKPLRLITTLGVLMLIAAAGVFIAGFITRLRSDLMIIATIWLVGGILTCVLGIIGEYLGRVLAETKKRPRYHIAETANLEENCE